MNEGTADAASSDDEARHTTGQWTAESERGGGPVAAPPGSAEPGKRPRKWLALPPILIGIAVIAALALNRPAAVKAPAVETATPVRTITLAPTTVTPRIIGYGFVEPGRIWDAVAQVAGTVVEREPLFERGRRVEQGQTLLVIDPTDYDLAIAQIEAELTALDAQLDELDVQEENLAVQTEIEARALALSESELERQRDLRSRGTVSEVAVDAAETATLGQRQRVQDLENQARLLPAQRAVLVANRAQAEARLEQARVDRQRTEIRAPFDGRVAAAGVEVGRYVRIGDQLGQIDGIDVAEVTTQLSASDFGPFLDLLNRAHGGPAQGQPGTRNPDRMIERLGLSAEIQYRLSGRVVRWDARVDRVTEQVDPETRTIGMVVAVDEPYTQVVPGQRPPLVKNLFVEVEVRGKAIEGQLVVPRAALHRGEDGRDWLYVANGEDRLERREVAVLLSQDDFAVVTGTVEAGNRVIVSDLVPAIDGMLLEPETDTLLEQSMAAAAGDGVRP